MNELDRERAQELARIIDELDGARAAEDRPEALYASIRENLNSARLQLLYAIEKYYKED